MDECELTKQVLEYGIAADVAKKLSESKSSQDKSKFVFAAESTASFSSTFAGKMKKKVKNRKWKKGRGRDENSNGNEKKGLKEIQVELPEAGVPPTLQRISKGEIVSQDTGDVSANQLKFLRKKVLEKLANKSSGPTDLICIWDFAGQLEYYITHHIFITDSSAYGVVFSLLDNLDELAKSRDFFHKGYLEMTNLQMIIFWIRSIFEHAVLLHGSGLRPVINGMIASPPISLIATHKDLLPGTDAEKQAKIDDVYNRIFKEIEGEPYECHIDREKYAVDNTAALDEGMQRLKRNVGSYMKSMARTVPIAWVDFQTRVQEAGKTTLRMSLNEITKIAVDCGINEEIIIHVLRYLNDMGIILYSDTNKKLSNTVITNIHMLIGIFMKIITVVKPDDVDQVPVMVRHWRQLDQEGILEEPLARYLWRNELSCNDIFEDFIELMKIFGLLFEKNKSEEGIRVFIVPSRMKIKTNDRLEVKKDEKQTVSFYVMPKHFLPDAVYNILVVRFVSIIQDSGWHKDSKLFQNQAEIGFDEKHYLKLGRISIHNKNALKLEISRREEKYAHGVAKPPCKPHSVVVEQILRNLQQCLDEVYPSKYIVSYVLEILCPACSTLGEPHFQELENCLKYNLITCDKTGEHTSMSTAYVQNLYGKDLCAVNERTNFQSVQFLIIDLGTEQMRKFFMNESQLNRRSDVGKFLIKEKNTALKDVDFEGQESNVFSPDANIDKFDMTTLLLLIRYCFNHSKEASFWKSPPVNDNSKLANLVRIYWYKKTVLDYSSSNRITDEDLDNRWEELTAMFTGTGVPVEDIEQYRNPWKQTEEPKGYNKKLITERADFAAINLLVCVVGKQQMKKMFLSQTHLKETDVGKFLSKESKEGLLHSVKFMDNEKELISSGEADINTFNITLLMKLIQHYSSSYLLSDFWVTPDESVVIKLANLILIHQYHNNHLAHCPNTRMSNIQFEQDWPNLTDYLLKSGANSTEIQMCERVRMAWLQSIM